MSMPTNDTTQRALSRNLPRPLPLWLKVAGSVVATGHLLVIGLYALAADSGPWPYNNGPSHSPGPAFATSIVLNCTYPYYLKPLRMTHNYHFASNRSSDLAVYFEVQLKGELGEVRTLKFPDEKANFWVRHRHDLLAQYLFPDQRLPPRGNQRLPALGKEVPKVEIWVRAEAGSIRLKQVEELDDLLRNPEVEQPTERAKLFAQSYARYLCRAHKAVSAEVIRHSRLTVMPMDLYAPRPELFNEMKSYFGEYRRE
jgi:hypothetical protein